MFKLKKAAFFNYSCAGYVQGMSDLLAPILMLMENEADAFWCFAALMERIVCDPFACA